MGIKEQDSWPKPQEIMNECVELKNKYYGQQLTPKENADAALDYFSAIIGKEQDINPIENGLNGQFFKSNKGMSTTNLSETSISYWHMMVLKKQQYKNTCDDLAKATANAKNVELSINDPSVKKTIKLAKRRCEESLKQLKKQDDMSLELASKKALADVNKTLAKTVDDVKEVPKCIEGFLQMIMQGWCSDLPTLSKQTFTADKLIDNMLALLDKITVASAVVPPPPGLKELSGILNVLKQMKPDPAAQELLKKMDPKPNIDVPPDIWNSISGISESVFVLMTMFPIILIQLIFNMLNAIIGMFLQIAGVLGVPSIPYPLNLVPQAITVTKDIFNVMMMFPPTIKAVVMRKVKDKMNEIAALQDTKAELDSIYNTPNPESLPACPNRENVSSEIVASLQNELDDAEQELAVLKMSKIKIDANDKETTEKFNKEIESYEKKIADIEKQLDKAIKEEAEVKKQEEQKRQKKLEEIEKNKKKKEAEEAKAKAEEANVCAICGKKGKPRALCPFGAFSTSSDKPIVLEDQKVKTLDAMQLF